MTIQITYLESQFTETGKEKLEELAQAEEELMSRETYTDEMPEGYDPKFKDLYSEMGILCSKDSTDEPYFEVAFTEEDYEYVELDGGIIAEEISHFFKTNGEDNTTIIKKDGNLIKVKESVQYLHKSLRNN